MARFVGVVWLSSNNKLLVLHSRLKVKRLGRVRTSNFVVIKSDGNWLLLIQVLFAMFASIVIDPTGPKAAERNSIFRLMESAKYAEKRSLASDNEKCGAWKESSSARADPFSSISDRYRGATFNRNVIFTARFECRTSPRSSNESSLERENIPLHALKSTQICLRHTHRFCGCLQLCLHSIFPSSPSSFSSPFLSGTCWCLN